MPLHHSYKSTKQKKAQNAKKVEEDRKLQMKIDRDIAQAVQAAKVIPPPPSPPANPSPHKKVRKPKPAKDPQSIANLQVPYVDVLVGMCDCKSERITWNRKVSFRVTNAFAVFTLFSSKPLLFDQFCFNYWVV
jgi:hypothetical protein